MYPKNNYIQLLFSALHLAAMSEQDKALEILLLNGASPNIASSIRDMYSSVSNTGWPKSKFFISNGSISEMVHIWA